MKKPILLAEDSLDDAESVQVALKNAGVHNPVYLVRDGDTAIAYLKGEGDFSCRETFPMPGVLLLDLNMPRVDGFQVLEWVRQQPELREMLVVVLSGHHGVREVKHAYAMGANSFLFKPANAAEIKHLVKCFEAYWHLPPEPAGEPNPAKKPAPTPMNPRGKTAPGDISP